MMRGVAANYRLARRRSLARLRAYLHPQPADCWMEAIEQLPDGNSINVMRQIDRLPKDVRALIHEYGLIAVASHYNEGIRGRELAAVLKAHRLVMQNKWLQADM